jgi:glutamate synthase domain-containing protein 2
MLPGSKVTAEIAATRGVRQGEDCVSPARHGAFRTPVELLEFVERLRRLSGGKPTGFKLCIGHPWEWFAICKAMLETRPLPDFIVVDGAEGGTGAAPLEFVDHVGTPLQEGLLLVHNTLVGLGLRDRIKLGCSGKIVSAFDVARAMALGADWCNSARGFMFALGCLQAQTCHTGNCPTGVATQDPLRQKALAVPDKLERVYRFHHHTLGALRELTQAAGLLHPNEFRATHLVRRVSENEVRLLANVLPQLRPGQLLEAHAGRAVWPHKVYELYWPRANAGSFAANDLAPSGDVDIERVIHETAA